MSDIVLEHVINIQIPKYFIGMMWMLPSIAGIAIFLHLATLNCKTFLKQSAYMIF